MDPKLEQDDPQSVLKKKFCLTLVIPTDVVGLLIGKVNCWLNDCFELLMMISVRAARCDTAGDFSRVWRKNGISGLLRHAARHERAVCRDLGLGRVHLKGRGAHSGEDGDPPTQK